MRTSTNNDYKHNHRSYTMHYECFLRLKKMSFVTCLLTVSLWRDMDHHALGQLHRTTESKLRGWAENSPKCLRFCIYGITFGRLIEEAKQQTTNIHNLVASNDIHGNRFHDLFLKHDGRLCVYSKKNKLYQCSVEIFYLD